MEFLTKVCFLRRTFVVNFHRIQKLRTGNKAAIDPKYEFEPTERPKFWLADKKAEVRIGEKITVK